VRGRVRVPEFVEPAGTGVDDEHVPVAAGVRAALDEGVARDRVRAAVGVLGVVEGDRYLGLAAGDVGDRDADRAAVPDPGTEVRLEAGGGAHGPDERGTVALNRKAGDLGVPDVGRREVGAAAQ